VTETGISLSPDIDSIEQEASIFFLPFPVVSACSSIDKYSRNTLMLVSVQLD